MTEIIYSGKLEDRLGSKVSYKSAKETFWEAIKIHYKLLKNKSRIGYFFIDPLINNFEAANKFYFRVFDCQSICKINTYKSGAGPIQALSDAKELINYDLYDAVFIFGYEPLLTNKQIYGKEAITQAMRIFPDKSILECYNHLAKNLCRKYCLSEDEFIFLCDQLYLNYKKTYENILGLEVEGKRGKTLSDLGANLFQLTDCANPNIDFSGGIIVTSKKTSKLLQIPENKKVKVTGASYCMVQGSPQRIDEIVGKKGNIFPHLKTAVKAAANQSNLNIVQEFKKGNLYLEAYTCYPPIPMAFLLATEIVGDMAQLPAILKDYEITITGGMNFAKAPWNNPALNGIIEMYQKLKNAKKSSYGLVHGNGGIGEVQGVAIFKTSNN